MKVKVFFLELKYLIENQFFNFPIVCAVPWLAQLTKYWPPFPQQQTNKLAMLLRGQHGAPIGAAATAGMTSCKRNCGWDE